MDRSRPTSTAARDARLQIVLRELERRFGPWIVYRLRDARPRVGGPATDVISSGSLALDLAIGRGGYPRGRLTELTGRRSSGKSILGAHLLANAQRQGGFVAFIDAGHCADFEQMGRCGVDLRDLFLVVPEGVRDAFDITTLLVESGGLDAVVVGPLTDLVGRSRQEGRDAAERVARLNAVLSASPTVVLFVSEQRSTLATLSLERALRHFATLRIVLTPTRTLIHPSGEIVGLRVRAHVAKNKLGLPERHAELELRRDRGIHREAECVDLGLAIGLLIENSQGICFGRTFLGRGRGHTIAALESDPPLAMAISREIVERVQS
jgi:recombination protein RecA